MDLDSCIPPKSKYHTCFFRDYYGQAKHFEDMLSDLIEQKLKSGNKKLTIWSAGCSSGEEPYTLAILINYLFKTNPHFRARREWDIKIYGTDRNIFCLERAKKGIFLL